MGSDPKVIALVGVLVVAVFVASVLLGGTRTDDRDVPNVDDPQDVRVLEAFEGVLHRLPGLGPGRHLEPRDMRNTSCGNGAVLTWAVVNCAVSVPDEVGVVELQWEAGQVGVSLQQEGLVDGSIDLPGDLDLTTGRIEDRRVRLRVFEDDARLTLTCRDTRCQVVLVGEDG